MNFRSVRVRQNVLWDGREEGEGGDDEFDYITLFINRFACIMQNDELFYVYMQYILICSAFVILNNENLAQIEKKKKNSKENLIFLQVPFTTVQTYFHRSREGMVKAMLALNERDNELPNQIQVPVPVSFNL